MRFLHFDYFVLIDWLELLFRDFFPVYQLCCNIIIVENIRKMITSNYKNILDEMQITLARETLSKCIGDVKTIKENILPKNGKRQQRMSKFLQFILQEDHNVIEFEKMLRNNGLEELLKINEDGNGEHLAPQDIGVFVIYKFTL